MEYFNDALRVHAFGMCWKVSVLDHWEYLDPPAKLIKKAKDASPTQSYGDPAAALAVTLAHSYWWPVSDDLLLDEELREAFAGWWLAAERSFRGAIVKMLLLEPCACDQVPPAA